MIIVLVALWASLATPLIAKATTLEPLTVSDLSRRAKDAFVGTVISTSAERESGLVRTAVQLRVTDHLKGRTEAIKTVYVPGGRTADGMTAVVEDMPSFDVGESTFVFADSRGWVMAGHQGKMGIARGKVRGRPVEGMAAEVRAASSGAPDPGQPVSESVTDVQSPEPAVGEVQSIGAPVITSIDPGVVSAGTGTKVTITGGGFGDTRGDVSFYYQSGQPRISATTVESWSDTRIVCVVPVAIVNDYSASAGSGPVIVRTAGGVSSAGFTLGISFGNGLRRWGVNSASSPRTRVAYRVTPGGVARAEELVDAAAGVWSAAGAEFSFVDDGVGSTAPGTWYDGRNDISWSADVPAGVLAQAQSYTGGSGQITESNIVFNTAYRWADGSNGSMDIQSIAIHEMGHWLSLRDLYGPGDTSKVMYGFASGGSVKRALTSGDRAGILWIYGAAPVPEVPAPPVPAPVDPGDEETVTPAPTPAVPAPSPVPTPTTGPATPTPVPVVRTYATLTRPAAPSSALRRRVFTVRGYLKPRHASGTYPVQLRCYRSEGGRWVLRKTVIAKVADYYSFSRYTKSLSLPYRGRWRIRGYHSDADHNPSYSPYEYLTIR